MVSWYSEYSLTGIYPIMVSWYSEYSLTGIYPMIYSIKDNHIQIHEHLGNGNNERQTGFEILYQHENYGTTEETCFG